MKSTLLALVLPLMIHGKYTLANLFRLREGTRTQPHQILFHWILLRGTALLLLSTQTGFAADPIARDDDFLTTSNQMVTGILSSNDENLDGPSDSYSILSNPANGVASVDSDGSFTYTPNISYVGNDAFSYGIDDGAGGTSSAWVNVKIVSNIDLISSSSSILLGLEDTDIPLGLEVAPAVYAGGEMQDLLSSDTAFRDALAGTTPVVLAIPARTSSIVITGLSTQRLDTVESDEYNDDYQLLNVRINLIDGTSSGRVALVRSGGLANLDQYSWVNAPLGQSILSDTNNVKGFYATGDTDPNFTVVGDVLKIIETHLLDSAYLIEYMTSDGDSASFLGAVNSVQAVGTSSSALTLPIELDSGTGEKGFVSLNVSSAAAGINSSTESKGFARLLIDLESQSVSGNIAALIGEGSDNTVTYSFSGYPLIDKRISGDTPSSILTSSATILGDTTATSNITQNPTIYIDASGQLQIERAQDFAATFNTMYTAEFYERNGLGSVASFVSSSSADALFDEAPADGVDQFGKPIDVFSFPVPASARIGLLQASWSGIAGDSLNENMGAGIATIDLESGTSSGSLTFIRTTTPDLLSWNDVPFGTTFFGASNAGGNLLYVSNKSSGSFTDGLVETATFTVTTNSDGSRTLTFSAPSSAGEGGNWNDYRGNAIISWLGNEPVSISAVPSTGVFSHGTSDGNGGWEIDIAELPLLSYVPATHRSGVEFLPFNLSSTGETENLELRIAPIADAPTLLLTDAVGYVDSAFSLDIDITDSADADGSETQPATVAFLNVPAEITLSATSGVVTDLGSGSWTADRASLGTLMASASSEIDSTNIMVSVLQVDEQDVDGDLAIEDTDNGNGIDEFDDLLVSESFSVRVQERPTVTSLLTNNGAPVISGTGTPSTGETLTATINGVVYSNTGSELLINGDGTWTLTIPIANTLPENTYSVTVELAHTSGTNSIDTSDDELVVDLTPPPLPGVTIQTTADTTPVIQGSATLATGDVLKVEVNGIVYTTDDDFLRDNGNSTWTLTIPSSNVLSEGVFNVTASVTDGASNVSTDPSSNELNIDLTAPVVPTVDVQLTNSNTPTLSGTATVESDETLSVIVNGITYMAGNGDLVDNTNGTWTLTIPSSNSLPEASYDVSVRVSDAALNVSTDSSTQELNIDLTLPAAPTINAQLTNSSTPTLSGTATAAAGEILSVAVNGASYIAGDGSLTDHSDGTWTLAIPPGNELPEGTLDVSVTVTDAASNSTSDTSIGEVEIDLTAPQIPEVFSQISNTGTPVIAGTAIIATDETLRVDVNGTTYVMGNGDLVDNTDGTWTLTIPPTDSLPEASYDVTASVIDAALNVSTDPSNQELSIDLTSPLTPTIAAQFTNSSTPTLTGTATLATDDILRVLVNGVSYFAGDGNLNVNSDDTWTLVIPDANALPEGILDVTITVTDTASNISADSSSNELTIDVTAPLIPTVNTQLTNSSTPTLNGAATVAAGETLRVIVNSVSYVADDGNLTDNANGTWTLVIPASNKLPEGTLDASITVSDAAGNSTGDATVDEIEIDLTAPQEPSVTNQIVNSGTPVITGTAVVALGETLSVVVNGIRYTAGDGNLVTNTDSIWTLTIPPSNLLTDAIYDVTATVSDAALNVSTDPGNQELIIDLTPPMVPTVSAQLTNSSTPTLNGTVILAPDETLTVMVNGVTYSDDAALVVNSDDTWTLVIPTLDELPEGSLDVVMTVLDSAGNSSTDTSVSEIQIDLTLPAVPTVTTQITNSLIPVITGSAAIASGDTLSVEVNNIRYTDGDGHLSTSGGNWTLAIPASEALDEAVWDVQASINDMAGNTSIDLSGFELVIDITAPLAPGVASQTTSDNTPQVTGSTTIDSTKTLRVEINGIIYTEDDGNLANNGDGSWVLNIPLENSLSDGLYQVIATSTDSAGNVSSDSGTDELKVDTRQPSSPGVTSQTINTDTPVILGTATVAADETLSVEVNGITYTAGNGDLAHQSDGTWTLIIPESHALPEGQYDVTVRVTDTALNVAIDPSQSELLIDLTPPASPTVNKLLTNVTTPMLSGTAIVAANEIFTVIVNGEFYSIDKGIELDVDTKIWQLNMPVDAELKEATYDVVATIADVSGNRATDSNSKELIIDLTAPSEPTIDTSLANSSRPTLRGAVTIASGEFLDVVINGKKYSTGDDNLVDNTDGSWILVIPAQDSLPDGAYIVDARTQDAAGNSSASVEKLLLVDTLEPQLATTGVQQASSRRPYFSGSSDTGDGSIVRVADAQFNLICEATVRNSAWSCVSSTDLPEGETVLSISTTDAAGNTATINSAVTVSSDFDGDGIPNSIEGSGDSDNDGLPDNTDPDSDNDGLPDLSEGIEDSDGDGLADYLDGDADNDGITDLVEALGRNPDTLDNLLFDPLQLSSEQILDTDFDGIPDFLDVDSDQDGIPDLVETLGSDTDNDGRVDNFTDLNANGRDDGLEVIRAPLLDTDDDGLPDYRDLDSDNDGIYDLVEVGGIDANNDGIIDTTMDANVNGIPDIVDVFFTGGNDIDLDGIDDRADASFVLGDDSDGDGIVDASDPDIDGDGWADTAPLNVLLASALPDTDLNGTPDFQQSENGAFRTSVSGRGGCSISQDSGVMQNPLLFFFTCLSLIGIALGSRRKKHIEKSIKHIGITTAIPGYLRLVVATMALFATTSSSAQDFKFRPYAGFGLGQSYLEPDSQDVMVNSIDKTDRSISVILGTDLTRRFAVELVFDDLGRALYSDGVYVGYQIASASMLIRGFNVASKLSKHQGFSLYGRLGASHMKNKSNFTHIRNHDISLSFGGGVDYGLNNGMALRAGITSFDTDAHSVGLFLLYRPLARESDVTLPQNKSVNVQPIRKSEINKNTMSTAATLKTPDSELLVPTPNTHANDRKEIIIGFDLDSSFLDKLNRINAARIAVRLNNIPKLNVRLIGYADDSANAAYNRQLANSRVNKVKSALTIAGIDPARISTSVVSEVDNDGPLHLRYTSSNNRQVTITFFDVPR